MLVSVKNTISFAITLTPPGKGEEDDGKETKQGFDEKKHLTSFGSMLFTRGISGWCFFCFLFLSFNKRAQDAELWRKGWRRTFPI